MEIKHRKLLTSLLSLFMVCLIASMATTPVMTADWGTLKAGDEMTWKDYETNETVKIKILEVNSELKVEKSYNDGEPFETTGTRPWILSRTGLTSDTQNYEWQGNTYKAYHRKADQGDGSFVETWRDFDTGILFKFQTISASEETTVLAELLSSTADMAEVSGGGGGCLGTLLIAMVSVTAIVAYGLIRYRRKG